MIPGVLVVFDAPANLKRCFLDNGFLPFGRQAGAWHRKFDDRTAADAHDIEYELAGVGLSPRWWEPKPTAPNPKPAKLTHLGKNIPPNTDPPPGEIKRLNKAATRWLETHDKPSAAKKFVDRKRKERARRVNRVHKLR